MRALFSILLLALASAATARNDNSLKAGDILFQFIPCGPLCDAIVATTPCAEAHPFNHCGIIIGLGDSLLVLEAIGKDVHETPLRDFLRRDTGASVYIGRLKQRNEAEIAANLGRARRLVGRPYDDSYLPGDSALYCSELVYESYYRGNRRMFSTEPMRFSTPDGKIFPGWARYYQDLGRPVPEGQPGTNPCGLSLDPQIRLFRRSKAQLLSKSGAE